MHLSKLGGGGGARLNNFFLSASMKGNTVKAAGPENTPSPLAMGVLARSAFGKMRGHRIQGPSMYPHEATRA